MYEPLCPCMSFWNVLTEIELTKEQKEQRRMLAAKDLEAGMSQADVARKYGVDNSNVSRWDKARKENGLEGLRSTTSSGRPSKIGPDEKEELVEILKKGATESGFQTDVWTGKRVSKLIKDRFKVEYHFKHMPKLLRRLGFRQIKPKRKPHEQNEEARKEWLETTWEYVKKTRRWCHSYIC